MSLVTATAIGTILVNDRPQPFVPGTTLLAVVQGLGLADRKGVAVAVNAAVVPRSAWAERRLAPDDRLIVIQATQGG